MCRCLLLTVLLIAGCGSSAEVKIDGSSEQAWQESFGKMTKGLSNAELLTLQKDMATVVSHTGSSLEGNPNDSLDEQVQHSDKVIREALHGMTRNDIHRTAQSFRP